VSITRGPAVTISYHLGERGTYVIRVNDVDIPTFVGPQQGIGNLQDWIRQGFETFATNLNVSPTTATNLSAPPTPQKALAALHRLTATSNTVMGRLFGPQEPGKPRIDELLRPFYPGRQDDDMLVERPPQPALFNIVGDLDRFLPLELLPLFDARLLPRFDTTLSAEASRRLLRRVAMRYPAFSTVVCRQFPTITPIKNDDRASELDNFQGLPVRFFQHNGLAGANLEGAFFDGLNGGDIHLVGPWPSKVEPAEREQMTDELAGWLLDATGTYGGRVRPDEVQHFSCHCDTDPYNPLRSKLTFHENLVVLLGDLIGKIPLDGAAPAAARRPLVFLNGCRSSQTVPEAVTSFPRFFLDRPPLGCGDRGMIGTVARVPDRFAAEFAERVYRYLFTMKPLGEAIYHTKWDLLLGKDNPLGMLYLLYADPNIRMRVANSEIASKPLGPAGPAEVIRGRNSAHLLPDPARA
jgi:CHAT domain